MDPLLDLPVNNTPQDQPAAKVVDTPTPTVTPKHHKSHKRAVGVIAGIILLVAALSFGLWWIIRKNDEAAQVKSDRDQSILLAKIKASEAAQVKSDRYQSIFLANGQVYFGKIAAINDHYMRVSDIFYLQAQQTIQATDSKTTTTTTDTSSKPQLIKLGNEMHAPEDAMQINRDQVLFWENIKPDGQVAKAISEFSGK